MPDLASSRPAAVRLFALCFTMLFVELALIRWLGSNVVFVSYFSNLVLLGSFLGIGIGFLRAGRPGVRPWAPFAPIGLALLMIFVTVLPVRVNAEQDGLIFFGGSKNAMLTGAPIWVTLPLIFIMVAFVLATIGESVARVFGAMPPLRAYRLDVLGSLAGIGAFTLLSFLGAPPIVWGLVVAALFLWLIVVPSLDRSTRNGLLLVGVQAASLVVMLGVLLHATVQPDTSWSPYYQVERHTADDDTIHVFVNGLPHQAIQSIEQRQDAEPFYFEPHKVRAPGPLDDVLVVGAGNGTDVAIALANDARHVDAVEIDPVLLGLGKRLHPDRPYQDDRVDAHVNDGRAFLQQSDRRYDLIVFALPDSLTLVSGQSSLRLESYLFTKEAMATARRHLTPDGTFAMYNYYRSDWLVDRLAGTLDETFGHAPCVQRQGGSLAVMTATRVEGADRCPSGDRWNRPSSTPAPATDDHPFLYLRNPSIPTIYLTTLGMILLVSLVSIQRVSGGIGSVARYGDLFLMGVAFLLLETKNVVQFALLFGTTWLVNALVFAAILVAVLAAIEVADRWRPSRSWVLPVALFATLTVAYLVDSSWLLGLEYWPRFAVAALVAFAPIFVANLIFADRFRDTASSTTAFGANLLGAMVGGVLEYGALLVGYRALLIAVAVLYLAAFLARRRIDGRHAPVSSPDIELIDPPRTVRDPDPDPVGT
ncbi:MAG: Spermine synthase [Thermoleophilia bacterium]|nr:Spermine synthase [Thermoleophilia bacterium]